MASVVNTRVSGGYGGLGSGFTTGGGGNIAPTFSVAPSIIGTPTVGVATAFTQGTASGTPTPTRTQQWTLDGVDIPGATSLTYTPISGDATKTLRVRDIATNVAGSANSTSTGVVVAAAGGAGFTTLSWTAPVGATSQTIYLSTSSDGQAAIGSTVNSATQQYRTLAAGATNAVITGLPSTGTWYYKLTATNAGGESDFSQEYQGTAV